MAENAKQSQVKAIAEIQIAEIQIAANLKDQLPVFFNRNRNNDSIQTDIPTIPLSSTSNRTRKQRVC